MHADASVHADGGAQGGGGGDDGAHARADLLCHCTRQDIACSVRVRHTESCLKLLARKAHDTSRVKDVFSSVQRSVR